MERSLIDDPLKPRRPPGVAEAPVALWFQAPHAVDADRLRAVATEICGNSAEATRLMHAIVPKSSLSRRGKLTQAQSEQTERLMRLFTMALTVFEDTEDARAFMRRPHPELGGHPPIQAAMTELGGRAVERVLDSLLYGLPV